MAGPRVRLRRARVPLRRRTLAGADIGGDEERSEEVGEVGVVADDQQVLGFADSLRRALKSLRVPAGGEGLWTGGSGLRSRSRCR